MNVRITQIDGKLPNLALMRLSAWHKARGDDVHFTRSVSRSLFECDYDRVYGSAIFAFSGDRVERFRREFPGAVVSGTGVGDPIKAEEFVGDSSELDYSLYPKFTASIGFTQRGCRLKCKFCVVPWKEGAAREVASIHDIWRGEGHPKTIHLLDNDFFGVDGWRDRIREIRDGGFRVCLNQGINVRLINEEAAAALATIEYRDDGFKTRRLYTAWDNLGDEKIFFRGVDMLERAGVPPSHLMAYMLIGYRKDETWDQILHRFDRMVERGIRPYPMVFDNARRDLKAFQRWAVTGLYRAFPFREYSVSAKPKDNMQMSLIDASR